MKTRTKIILAFLALLFISAAIFVALVIMDAENKLAMEKQTINQTGQLAVPSSHIRQQRLDEINREGWLQLSSLHDVKDMVLHEGFVYLASRGGLLKFTLSMEFAESYSQLNGLSDLDINCLFSYDGSLFIGSSKGLTVIREDQVSSTYINSPDFGGITDITEYQGELLLATRGAGVFKYDLSGFSPAFSNVPGADFKDVTCMHAWNGGLAVATRDKGVYILQGASFENYTAKEGLAADHVTSLAGEAELLVATVEGVSKVNSNLKLSPWLESRMASALLEQEGSVYLGTLDGRCNQYIRGASRSNWIFGNRYQPAVTRKIVQIAGQVWALTSNGAFSLAGKSSSLLELPGDISLQGNYVASMVVGSKGQLWLGYFDQGVEVFDSRLKQVKYFSEPELKTIKHLVFDPREEYVYAGSSKGFTTIDSRFSISNISREEGLINNEVNHISVLNSGEISLATGGGLSLLTENGVKSIYAFHGLINNKVFCQLETELDYGAISGRKLLVGTLGGISVVKGQRVLASITPENSQLPIHWITAMAEVNGAVFIGTYGGGVAVINPDGSWAEMPEFMKKLEINPNAFMDSEEYFLAGTLDQGILLLDKEASRWQVLQEGLGSLNVTAFAQDESRYYIGTDSGVTIIAKGSLVK